MKEKTGYEEKMKLLEIFVEKFTELFDFFSTSYKTLPRHLKQEILETLVRNFFYNGKNLFVEPSPLLHYMIKSENLQLVVQNTFEWNNLINDFKKIIDILKSSLIKII